MIRAASDIGGLNVDYVQGEIFDDVLVSNSYNEDKCVNCGRVVMLPRVEFNKKIKKVISE